MFDYLKEEAKEKKREESIKLKHKRRKSQRKRINKKTKTRKNEKQENHKKELKELIDDLELDLSD